MQSSEVQQIVNKWTGEVIPIPTMPSSVLRFFQATGRIGGAIGGVSRSRAKVKAARKNGKLGGRPCKKPPEVLPQSELNALL